MKIVNKVLTMKDVEKLNGEKGSVVVLKNTVGQSVEVLKHLSPEVKVQIIGGYDASKKPKYGSDRIQKRTFYSPSEVCAIISKFEEYEAGIDDSWDDLKKAAYMYQKLGENIVFKEDKYAVKNRNLNTVLGEGVCAGYAIVYKEAMDRLGIECDIINEPRVHTWNALTIDGKKYPVDLTWDAAGFQKKKGANPEWFGQNPAFSKFKNHNAMGEAEVVSDNCFDARQLADVFNEVTNSQGYAPVVQEDLSETLFADGERSVEGGADVETIMEDVRKFAMYAVGRSGEYHNEAYVQDFGSKFNSLLKTAGANPNLTGEQRQSVVAFINNVIDDVMGGKFGFEKAEISMSGDEVETQIKIVEPIEIVDAELPSIEDKNKAWMRAAIADYNVFLNGLKESGTDLEDEETTAIINACCRNLDALNTEMDRILRGEAEMAERYSLNVPKQPASDELWEKE